MPATKRMFSSVGGEVGLPSESSRPQGSSRRKRKRKNGDASRRESLQDQPSPQDPAKQGPRSPSRLVQADYKAPEPPGGLELRAPKRRRKKQQAALDEPAVSEGSPAPADDTTLAHADTKPFDTDADHIEGEVRRRRKRKRKDFRGAFSADVNRRETLRTASTIPDDHATSYGPIPNDHEVRSHVHTTYGTKQAMPQPPPKPPHSKLSALAPKLSRFELVQQASTTTFPRAPVKRWSDYSEPNSQLRRVSSVHERAEKSCQTEIFGQLHLPLVFAESGDEQAALLQLGPVTTTTGSQVRALKPGASSSTTIKPQGKVISKAWRKSSDHQASPTRLEAVAAITNVDRETSTQRSPALENTSGLRPSKPSAIAAGHLTPNARAEESANGDRSDDEAAKSYDDVLDADSATGVDAAEVVGNAALNHGDAGRQGERGGVTLSAEASDQDQDMAESDEIVRTKDQIEPSQSQATEALAESKDEPTDEDGGVASVDGSESDKTTSDDDVDDERDPAAGVAHLWQASELVDDARLQGRGNDVNDDQLVTWVENARPSKASFLKPQDLRPERTTSASTTETSGSERSYTGDTNDVAVEPLEQASAAVSPPELSQPGNPEPQPEVLEAIIISSGEEESSELEESSEDEAPAANPTTTGAGASTLATSTGKTNRSEVLVKPLSRSSLGGEQNSADRASRQSSLFAGIDSRKTYLGVGAGNRLAQQPSRQPAKKAMSVPSTVPQTDAKTAFDRFSAFLGQDTEDEESSSSDESDTDAAPPANSGAEGEVKTAQGLPVALQETRTAASSVKASLQPTLSAGNGFRPSAPNEPTPNDFDPESDDSAGIDNTDQVAGEGAGTAAVSEDSDASEHEDDSEDEVDDAADEPPKPKAALLKMPTTPATASANSATRHVQCTPTFTQINNERASQQLARESQAAESDLSKFATVPRVSSTKRSEALQSVARTANAPRCRLPDLDSDIEPVEERGLEPKAKKAATTMSKSAVTGKDEATQARNVGMRSTQSMSSDKVSAQKITPEKYDAGAHVLQPASASRLSAAAKLREARIQSAKTATAQRVEVPGSQKTNETAILDGLSEDEGASGDELAKTSRSISSAHATSTSTRPDSRTSFSVPLEQSKPSASQPASFLDQRLGGAGSGEAPNDGPVDSNLLGMGKPLDNLSNTQCLYRDIDEVTNEVMSSTRELPTDKATVPDLRADHDSPTIQETENAGKVKQGSRRRSLGKGKMIPIVARQEITCFAAQLLSPVIERCIEANSWTPPNRTDEHDQTEQQATPANPGLTEVERQTSESSLSERAETPTPPPDIVEPPVRQDSEAIKDAEDISTSDSDGNYEPETVKKKRKMTGNSSKHFSRKAKKKGAGKRSRRNQDSDFEPDASEDDPSTPLAERTMRKQAKPRRRTTGTKSPHFLPLDKLDRVDLPTPSQKRGRWPAGVSKAPVPPTTAERFGIIQEKLWQEPFWLLIAVTFLNQTTGRAAVPVFWDLKSRWPTPRDLAGADRGELLDMITHLGLQRQRTNRVIAMAKAWIAEPPQIGRRFRTKHYPAKDDQRQFVKLKVVETDSEDCAGALEIGHIPGCGPYAWDSWRIFCRDVLRGVADDYNGKGSRGEGFQPEWKRVLPKDKELRATLRWMWLREGYIWDHETGEKREATEEEKENARLGQMHFADEKEEKFAEIAAGVTQAGEAAETTKEASPF